MYAQRVAWKVQSHDWNKEYQQVCADIVDEMIDIFDKPEFFHLGFEEENVEYQKYYPVKIERS